MKNEWKQMLRPEQNSFSLMNDLVDKFSKPGDFVLEAFAGMVSTTKASLLLDNHWQIVGCVKDCGCVEQYMVGHMEVYVCQVLDDIFNLKSE